jgi:hypothetical protein
LTLTVAYAGDRLNVAFLKGRQGPEILQINLNLKHCKDMIDLGRHLFSDSIEREHLFKHNLVFFKRGQKHNLVVSSGK